MVFSYIEALREDPSGALAGFPSDTMVTIPFFKKITGYNFSSEISDNYLSNLQSQMSVNALELINGKY